MSYLLECFFENERFGNIYDYGDGEHEDTMYFKVNSNDDLWNYIIIKYKNNKEKKMIRECAYFCLDFLEYFIFLIDEYIKYNKTTIENINEKILMEIYEENKKKEYGCHRITINMNKKEEPFSEIIDLIK